MKRISYFLLGVALTVQGAYAQTPSVTAIMEKVSHNEKIASSITHLDQTIITSKGGTRTLSIEGYSKHGGDDQLTVYTGPARVKGDKILMLHGGNDIWFYTPRTDRVRHLASNARKQKVQGSDFAYQDLEQRDYKKDFKITFLGTEAMDHVDHYKLEAIPTETGPTYDKLILWIDPKKFTVSKTDFYEDGLLLKTLIAADVRKTGAYWMAYKLEMYNHQSGSKTLIETKDIQVDVDLDDAQFSTQNLKRN